jgi:hypothetical protein
VVWSILKQNFENPKNCQIPDNTIQDCLLLQQAVRRLIVPLHGLRVWKPNLKHALVEASFRDHGSWCTVYLLSVQYNVQSTVHDSINNVARNTQPPHPRLFIDRLTALSAVCLSWLGRI